MRIFQGNRVSGGGAVGKAVLFKRDISEIVPVRINDTVSEKERFETAKEQAVHRLQTLSERAKEDVGENKALIFEIHIMMIEDEEFCDAVRDIIETESVCAEYAVFKAGERFSAVFSSMDDEYMRERAADVKDISGEIIACLTGHSQLLDIGDEKIILCADELSPSETIRLDKSRILAFAMSEGSANSHTAILARSLGIPCVTGLGSEFINSVKDGCLAGLDGDTGRFYLEPDDKAAAELSRKAEIARTEAERLSKLKDRESLTEDGVKIAVCANIASVSDMEDVRKYGADGVGLCRSEFLYMQHKSAPTEEELYKVYSEILKKAEGRKVIIRSLDVGADKKISYLDMPEEENPALGCRAIRYCFRSKYIFRTQLRALYRASVFGKLGIMFPMIVNTDEVKKILSLCQRVREELDSEGIVYSEDVKLGIMIETPAAALISDKLAEMVDFFSIGTNDLTQYTLACDRQNSLLDDIMDSHHPAVLKLIEITARNGAKHNISVSVCGELAADTCLTAELLKMGIRGLSVSPASILKVREAVSKVNISKS